MPWPLEYTHIRMLFFFLLFCLQKRRHFQLDLLLRGKHKGLGTGRSKEQDNLPAAGPRARVRRTSAACCRLRGRVFCGPQPRAPKTSTAMSLGLSLDPRLSLDVLGSFGPAATLRVADSRFLGLSQVQVGQSAAAAGARPEYLQRSHLAEHRLVSAESPSGAQTRRCGSVSGVAPPASLTARRTCPCLLGGTLTSDVCLLLPQETDFGNERGGHQRRRGSRCGT